MLNPKKVNLLYKEAAEKLNIPESDLTDIVSFYWQQVRKSMEGLSEPNIQVENFGTFTVKPRALKAAMYKYENFIASVNAKDFRKYPYYKIAVDKLEKFKVLSNAIQKENLRKKDKIDQRYGKNTNTDMEGQGENS